MGCNRYRHVRIANAHEHQRAVESGLEHLAHSRRVDFGLSDLVVDDDR